MYIKDFIMKMLSVVKNPFRKPAWLWVIKSFSFEYSFNLLFIMAVNSFPKQLSSVIGLSFSGFPTSPLFFINWKNISYERAFRYQTCIKYQVEKSHIHRKHYMDRGFYMFV